MSDREISYHEAQTALRAEAKTIFETGMRPNGHVEYCSVNGRHKGEWRTHPNIKIRLYINGTWEYEDGSPAGGSDEATGRFYVESE